MFQGQHSFCKLCINELDQRDISCPLCRTIDKRRVQDIQKNRLILCYLEMTTSGQQSNPCSNQPVSANTSNADNHNATNSQTIDSE